MKNKITVVEKIIVESILNYDRVLIMKWKNHKLSENEGIELNVIMENLIEWGVKDYTMEVLNRDYGFNGWIPEVTSC